jgi:DNA polymerase III delta prime subunit
LSSLDLANILVKKYANNQLAQVYLASYPLDSGPESWINNFIHNFTKLPDHPDVFFVTRSEKENNYKVDSSSIKDMLKFISYRPIEFKTRFIFFTDAHKMSDIVANKLLKVLEELPPLYCLFLLAPEGQHLLPTVESRAIKVRLPKSKETFAEVKDTPNFESVNELVQYLKVSEDPFFDEKKFIEQAISLMLSKSSSFEQYNEMLANLKHYLDSELYNNSKASRLSLIFP